MKERILITANAGTGKSTVSKILGEMGYESYDLEQIPDMFGMYRRDTKEPYEDFDNGNPDMIENADWMLHKSALEDLLNQQKNDIAFYSGTSSNILDLLSLFDKVFLLVVDNETLYKRLSNREGTNDMGGNEDSRQAVLGWKEWWENEIRQHKVVEISADGTPDQIAQETLRNTQADD